MTGQSPDARHAAWSDYWASGALHSCPGGDAGNYGGAIGAFWDRRIAALADDARVLDLATGNGALPLRLWQARGDAVAVDAIDFTSPTPAWHAPASHPRIRFHGGVDMVALPFGPSTFDVVASQFGIEYGSRPDALNEALRVLRTGGRLWLVLHHAGSELAAVARAESDAYDWLLGEQGLLAAATRMTHWLDIARAGGGALPPEAEQAREAYNRSLRQLGAEFGQGRARGLAVDVVQALHATLAVAAQGRGGEAQEALRRYRVDLARGALRGRELVAHALTEDDLGDWVSRIASAWPQAAIECEVLRQQEGLIAWGLSAEVR